MLMNQVMAKCAGRGVSKTIAKAISLFINISLDWFQGK